MARIIGCNSLHLAEVTKDEVGGATYGTPFSVPALRSIDIKDNGESVVFYSDDVVEQTINTMSDKEVTIELGYLTNEMESKITGAKYDNGVFSQSVNDVSKEYALMFKAPLSNGKSQYVVLYKGVLSRKDTAYKTKEDKVEGQVVTLSGKFVPQIATGLTYSKANEGDTGADEVIQKWFKEVYQKKTSQ